jgi:hypothetical protein
MTQTLPKFTDPSLRYFCFCLWFPIGESPLSKFISNLKKPDERETRFACDQGFAWIRIRVDPASEDGDRLTGHVHIECQPESRFSPVRSDKTPIPNPETEVLELLAMLDAELKGDICYEGSFRMPVKSLPARGTVNLMLGLPLEAGNARLAIHGMNLGVQDKEPYDDLRWQIVENADEDKAEIKVTISASSDVSSIGGDLQKMTSILSAGISELVLETGSEAGEKT